MSQILYARRNRLEIVPNLMLQIRMVRKNMNIHIRMSGPAVLAAKESKLFKRVIKTSRKGRD